MQVLVAWGRSSLTQGRKEWGTERGLGRVWAERNRIFFSVVSMWSELISLLRDFVCEGGFNVPTLLDETSFLFVQTIHYVVAAGRAVPLAGVFITELERALADSRRLMTGSRPERLRKP